MIKCLNGLKIFGMQSKYFSGFFGSILQYIEKGFELLTNILKIPPRCDTKYNTVLPAAVGCYGCNMPVSMGNKDNNWKG